MAEKDASINIGYYSEAFYPELVREGIVYLSGASQFSYKFDDTESKLIITTLTKYATVRGTSYAGQTFIPWKNIWKDEIVSIEVVKEVGGNKIQYQSECSTGLFDNYPNLVSIRFGSAFPTWQNNAYKKFGMFENNPKLISIAYDANSAFVSGVADIKHVNNCTNVNTLNRAFKNCPGIEKIIFRANMNEQNKVNGFGDSIFSGCTALKELEFYDSSTKKISAHLPTWVTSVSANAFNGCKSFDYLILNSTVTTVASNSFEGAYTKLICFD